MKNEYIRRGMLAGNSEIPIDLVPSLPGTVLFNSNLECEPLLGNEQSAHMIIRTELGDDLVTFTQNDASHIKSRISVPTIQINNNIVPKYKAEISQSVLVIQSPYTKTLEIVPVVNETVSNAAKAFGFFVSPDPRAISRVGEISSSPGIGQTSQHNLATYITRFEDKTSESINRAIDSVAKNVEDLHLRTKEYEAHTSDLTLVKLSGSIQTALDTVGNKPIAFYLDESGRAKTFISNQISLTTPFEVDPSLEFPTFKDAYNLQNNQTFARKTALQFDLQVQESGNNVFANTRTDSVNTKTSSKAEKFGINPIFLNQVSLHKVTDTISNLNTVTAFASDGQVVTPGFIATAGVFHKGKHINTGNFTVLDSNTIKLAQPLSIDIIKFAQADGLIALISDEFSYGFKITHVILNDTLIVEPIRDIEIRVGARIIGESYPQNLPIGLSGTYFMHIGDKAPRSFFSACHLISGQSIAVPSIPPYSVLVANINENCLTQANRRSDHDTRLNLRTVNSANTLDISDSLSSALSGNLSNRNAQSKLFTYPYIERLLHTNTDHSYGNNVYSSLIKAISSRNNILAHNVISASSISSGSVYNAVDFGIFSPDLQQLMTVLITLLFPTNTRSRTYVRPNGESTTIGTLIDEIDYTSNSSNPVVYMVLLIIVDFIPRLSQAFGLVAEYDGYLRSQSSQPFSRYDIGKDFVLNKSDGSSFLARMIEFVSPNVSRFVELRSGLNIQEGEYTNIVGLRGCSWSQSYDTSLSENLSNATYTIDTIKLNTHNLDLDQGIVLPNAKILQAGTSIIIHTGVQIDGMDASALNLIRILPDFLPFSVPSPVSQALADRLYPSFLRQANSPIFAPSNSYYSKSCLYLEASSNSYNLSGYYEIDEAFPIISNDRAYIGFKVGELVGKSLYQKSRLGNTSLYFYAPNNVIDKVINKYEFDITDPEIQSVSPIFCRAHEVTQDKNYQSIKGDIKIDDLSINIVDDGYPTISESKISIYSSIKNNAVSVLIPDTPIGSEQLPQPFLKINDLSNEQALITFSGNDVLTNQEYLRKRTNSSTISINKRDTSDSSAIAVTRGVDYAVDPALISVRDITRPTQTSSDEFGRENTLALSSVGNVSVSGLFRVESDVRDTARAITNYKGTGVNLIGGVDSHLNPTTSAHSWLKNAIYTADTNHVIYGDNAVEPHTQYPKYLGEAHVISKKGGPIQLINSVAIGPFAQYHNLSITFDTTPKPADVGRAVLLIYTDGSTLLGHVTGINGTHAICRFLGDIRLSEIEDASMLGREWNSNVGTIKISDKIDVIQKGSNDVVHSIYAQDGDIVGIPKVRNEDLECKIMEIDLLSSEKTLDQAIDDIKDTTKAIPSFYKKTAGVASPIHDEKRVSYIKTNQSYDPDDKEDVLNYDNLTNTYTIKNGIMYSRLTFGGVGYNENFIQPGKLILVSVDPKIESTDVGLSGWREDAYPLSPTTRVFGSMASAATVHRLVISTLGQDPSNINRILYFMSELTNIELQTKSDGVYLKGDIGLSMSKDGITPGTFTQNLETVDPFVVVRVSLGKVYNLGEDIIPKRYYIIGKISHTTEEITWIGERVETPNSPLYLVGYASYDMWWVSACLSSILGKVTTENLSSINTIRSSYVEHPTPTRNNSYIRDHVEFYNTILTSSLSDGIGLLFIKHFRNTIDISKIFTRYWLCGILSTRTDINNSPNMAFIPCIETGSSSQFKFSSIISALCATGSLDEGYPHTIPVDLDTPLDNQFSELAWNRSMCQMLSAAASFLLSTPNESERQIFPTNDLLSKHAILNNLLFSHIPDSLANINCTFYINITKMS